MAIQSLLTQQTHPHNHKPQIEQITEEEEKMKRSKGKKPRASR